MQQKNLFSPHWYRIASISPRLRKHIQLHRHQYRGQIWYILQDHSSGRFHRFTPAAYHLIGLMDGRHTMDQIWKHASQSLAEESLTQAQTIQLLAQLYKADALLTDVSVDTQELFERQRTTERRMKLQRWKSPLSIKVPLIDPDRFIVATLPVARLIFNKFGFLLWLIFVLSSLVTAFVHWPELTKNLVDRVLAGQNILILLVTFPIVKLFHEFGHAYAARVNGGEIHDMGVMFLILMPIPYVDATSSSAFASRWKRALVGSGGMLAELFLAAVALHIWLNIESGFVSAIMFNVMIIAGISTLLFNANPLIRFDGYYILADIIEIPNFGTRSTRYLGYLVQKYVFKIEDAKSPANAPGEKTYFVVYGIASFIYRMFLISFIVFLLADKYFIVGTILAIWAVFMMAIMPIYKQIKFVMTNPKLKNKRTRAISISAALIASLVGITLIPVPLTTVVEGIVWADQESRVRMESQGFVEKILIESGGSVTKGQPIIVTHNYEITANIARLRAQLDEFQAQYDAVTAQGQSERYRVQAELVKEQINATKAQISQVSKQIEDLTIFSPVTGTYVSLAKGSLQGRFLQRGEVVGFVVKSDRATARVLIPQDRISIVRQQTQSISVRVVDRIGEEIAAIVSREVPSATQDLPSAALSFQGGGEIATNPNQSADAQGGLSAFQRWFQMDISIDRMEDEIGLGERVYARFYHGNEAIGLQMYRVIRQTFLSKFNV